MLLFQGRWGSRSGVCVYKSTPIFNQKHPEYTSSKSTISGKQAKFPDYLIRGQAQLYLKDQLFTV